MNAVVVAIALLSSSRARPSLVQSPRRQRSGVTLTRRASSAVLQSLLSFSVFSFPSTSLSPYLQPDAATTDRETETEELTVRSSASPIKPSASPRALQLSTPSPATAADEEEEEREDPNAMSMDEAYALVLASQQRPEREREEVARRSEVDAKAEEFIRSFKEELRQQRLKSTSN